MSHQSPVQNETKTVLEDNARKFIIDSLESVFLKENNAISYILTTDWFETGEDSEKKIAYKKFENGDTQILFISKTTQNSNRTSEKKNITQQEYEEFLKSTVLRIEKKRYEFKYSQDGFVFTIKYDEFIGSQLKVLEVDADTQEERERFNPINFPAKLIEVTGDLQYYGYRIATVLK